MRHQLPAVLVCCDLFKETIKLDKHAAPKNGD